MDARTTSNTISPNWVGVNTWVFLFRLRYLMFTSFFRISARVALVPMPLPLIWARSSSSSMSCPAFSMARIMEPELYRFGGEVSPSRISSPSTGILSPFFSFFNASCKTVSPWIFSSSSEALSPEPFSPAFFSSEGFSWAGRLPSTFKYPSDNSILNPEKNFSPSMAVVRLTFWYTAGG